MGRFKLSRALLVALLAAGAAVPARAADDNKTAEQILSAEKTCLKLKGKSARDLAKLENCHVAGDEYGRRGSAVERNGTKSATYLAKACEGGLGKSCSLLSWYYLDNSAYDSSAEKSRYWDKKGCEVDDPTACAGMGYWMKSDGKIEEAKSFYRRAIALKPDYEYAKKQLAELEK